MTHESPLASPTTPKSLADELRFPATEQETQSHTPISKLHRECRATLDFLERAHHISIEAARRLGVPQELLEPLTPAASRDARQESLTQIRHHLLAANIGHTGSFPDYIGMADSLTRHFKEERDNQSNGTLSDTTSSFGFASPTNTLNTCAETLFVALSITSNQEQRGTCLVTLNLLISRTKDALPNVSKAVSATLSESLSFEANRPRHERR